MIRIALPALLLCLATLTACSDPNDPKGAPSERVATLEANAPLLSQTYIIWMGDTLDVQLRALDADGKGVPGVTLDLAVTGGGAVSAPSVLTDGAGAAQVQWILGAGEDSVVAKVAGREVSASATAHGRRMLAYLDVDELQVVGPACLQSEAAEILVQDSSWYGDDGRWSLVIEDTTVATVTHIAGAGGTRSLVGRQVWGRSPGVTRLILTQHHQADSAIVRVAARSGPAIALARVSPDQIPHTLVLGDTLTFAEATQGDCEADALPSDYQIDFESLDPQVIRVDSARNSLVRNGGSMYTPFRRQGVSYLRAVGTGEARVVASAPFSTPDTILIQVTTP